MKGLSASAPDNEYSKWEAKTYCKETAMEDFNLKFIMARDIAQVAEHLPSRHKKKVNYI
jgi:hypothetical protein